MHELERDAKKNIDAVCELEREGEIVRDREGEREGEGDLGHTVIVL